MYIRLISETLLFSYQNVNENCKIHITEENKSIDHRVRYVVALAHLRILPVLPKRNFETATKTE